MIVCSLFRSVALLFSWPFWTSWTLIFLSPVPGLLQAILVLSSLCCPPCLALASLFLGRCFCCSLFLISGILFAWKYSLLIFEGTCCKRFSLTEVWTNRILFNVLILKGFSFHIVLFSCILRSQESFMLENVSVVSGAFSKILLSVESSLSG